jgi:NitT/TauT family transport system permease protein
MAEKVPFRAAGFAPRLRPAAGAATLVLLLLAWEAGARLHLFRTEFTSTPTGIAREIASLIASGEMWRHLAASLGRLAWGWLLGTAAGLGAGFAIGLLTAARSPGMAVVSALFPIPKIALVPLFIIWFGIGEGSKLATLAFGVFFPTVIATVAAVDAVPVGLVRMAQSFGLPWASILRKVVLPGALPGILAGFRITAATAIVLLVAAEMIGAERGIGAFVLQAGNLYDIDALMAGIAMLSALGLAVSWLIGRAERMLLRWRRDNAG